LLYLARRSGLRIREVPVRWNHAEGSKVSFFRDSLRMLREVITVRRSVEALNR
jgi:dolichyl-phosphate beta-glucosyltransferase